MQSPSPLPRILPLVAVALVVGVASQFRKGNPASDGLNAIQPTAVLAAGTQDAAGEWQTSFVERNNAMSDATDYFAWQTNANQPNPVFDWKGGVLEQSSPGSTAVRRHIQWGEAPNSLAMEFQTDAQQWELYCAPTGNGWRVLTRDVDSTNWQVVGSWKTPEGGKPMLQHFQQQNGKRKLRRWRVEFADQLATGVRLKSKDTISAASAEPPLKRVVWCGDSYVEGTGAPSMWQGFAGQAGMLLNVDSQFDASGGTGYVASGPPALQRKPYGERIDNITQANPAVVVIYGSINDGRYPVTEVADAARKFWGALHQALPNAKIVAIGPASPGGRWNTQDLNKALQSAATGSNVTFIDASGWNLGNGAADEPTLVAKDGIHPSLAGHTFLAQKVAESLRPVVESTGN